MAEKTEFEKKLDLLAAPVELHNIEFRVQSVNKGKYATILAYKDARYDMQMLDDIIGPGNWQRKHESIGGVMHCSVGIWNPDTKEWVWKQDAGTESQTEKQKGAASDSFKRACFNWGIGRELYDFPKISFQLKDSEVIGPDSQGKFKASFEFQLEKYQWGMRRDETTKRIIQLACKDQHGAVRFRWDLETKNTSKP